MVPSLQGRPGRSSEHNDMMSIVYLSVADVRKPACDTSLISDIYNIYDRSDSVLCMKQSSIQIHEMDGYRDDATLTKYACGRSFYLCVLASLAFTAVTELCSAWKLPGCRTVCAVRLVVSPRGAVVKAQS